MVFRARSNSSSIKEVATSSDVGLRYRYTTAKSPASTTCRRFLRRIRAVLSISMHYGLATGASFMEVLRKAFSQQLDPAVSKFVGCVDDDKFIVDADIHGSIAHARMLAHTHIISEAQADNIVDGLQQLQAAYAEGQLQLKPQWEDVHMNVEGVLRHMVGEDALRLHTARSRNDQVALDMRIYVCEEIAQICRLLQRAQLEFIQLAEDNLDIVMPGYTHL